uniref:Uncharacterized protein n=1 Tax=viral metagenome TaxID=1070528 RepID=A0A6C0K7M4_9ZZZZ
MNYANNALDAAKSHLMAAHESLRLSRSELAAAGESVNSMPEILTGLDAALANVTTAEKAVNDLTPANGGRRRRKSRKIGRKSNRNTRHRLIQQRGGGNVFVVYKIGGPKSPDFVGVFPTLEAAKEEVEKDKTFEMESKVRGDGLLASKESPPKIHVYCQSVPSY